MPEKTNRVIEQAKEKIASESSRISDESRKEDRNLMAEQLLVVEGCDYEVMHAIGKLSEWLDLDVTRLNSTFSAHKAICIGVKSEDWIADILLKAPGVSGELDKVGDEGYIVKRIEDNILITGNTVAGAANGVYSLLRELRKRGSKVPFSSDFSAVEKPSFPIRGIYGSGLPWRLTKLTLDTWLLSDWIRYLDFMRCLGANIVKIYLWPTQFYHPDYEDSYPNKWRYEMFEEALGHAQRIGLRTVVGFTFNTTPPFIYLENPEVRAVEKWYHGIDLCWTRGREQIVPFQNYIIKRFSHVTNDFALWFADPGLCLCEDCKSRGDTDIVLDVIRTYRKTIHEYNASSRLALVTRMIPGDLDAILSEMPDGALMIGGDLAKISAKNRFAPIHFNIVLSPEGGLEGDALLFPNPMFSQIEEIIQQVDETTTHGYLGYRVTPYTRFICDYALLRKLWQRDLKSEELAFEIATQMCSTRENSLKFAETILLINEWWQTEERDLLLLKRIEETFDELVSKEEREKDRFETLRDSLCVLHLLTRIRNSEDVHEEVYLKMRESPIFQGYTLDESWISRGKAIVRDRIRWWTGR